MEMKFSLKVNRELRIQRLDVSHLDLILKAVSAGGDANLIRFNAAKKGKFILN